MLPLYSLLIIYLLFIVIFVVFIIFDIYHIVMSASMTAVSFFVTFLLISLGVLTIYGTWALLQGVDWTQPLLNLNNSGLGRF